MYWYAQLGRRAVVESVRPRTLEAGDAVPDREFHETGKILDVQLHHDAAAIRVDARRGDSETGGDFLARAARDHVVQHFPFAPAQLLERVVPALGHLRDVSKYIARL